MRDASEDAERWPLNDERTTSADERIAAAVEPTALAEAPLALRRERAFRPGAVARFERVPALPQVVCDFFAVLRDMEPSPFPIRGFDF